MIAIYSYRLRMILFLLFILVSCTPSKDVHHASSQIQSPLIQLWTLMPLAKLWTNEETSLNKSDTIANPPRVRILAPWTPLKVRPRLHGGYLSNGRVYGAYPVPPPNPQCLPVTVEDGEGGEGCVVAHYISTIPPTSEQLFQREEWIYKDAKDKKSLSPYESYLKEFPNGHFSEELLFLINEIKKNLVEGNIIYVQIIGDNVEFRHDTEKTDIKNSVVNILKTFVNVIPKEKAFSDGSETYLIIESNYEKISASYQTFGNLAAGRRFYGNIKLVSLNTIISSKEFDGSLAPKYLQGHATYGSDGKPILHSYIPIDESYVIKESRFFRAFFKLLAEAYGTAPLKRAIQHKYTYGVYPDKFPSDIKHIAEDILYNRKDSYVSPRSSGW